MGRASTETTALLRDAGRILAPFLVPPPAHAASESPTLIRFSQAAMATRFEVVLPFGLARANALALAAFQTIEELEAQLTVYRDDSEISLLNQRAAGAAVVVEDQLFRLLQLAQRLYRETWGAFDITAGPLIRTWGFFHRQGRMPTPSAREAARRRVGMGLVELDADRRQVCFQRDGIELNLGSIGKGYALDRVAEKLRAAACQTFLLHAGGSSALAAGTQPGEPRGWPVALRHAWRDEVFGTVYLQDRALGTSAATYQHFEYNQQKFGHILDPRTGRPAAGIASATALAPTAAEADALATAFYVLGIAKTRLYCQTHPGIGAILVPDEPSAVPAVIGLRPSEYTPTTAADARVGAAV